MNKKKVSIVLPVYNGERFLKDSITSILKQTYKNIELIIVNDCSTDNSLNIIEEFSKNDDRISVINNDTNKKLPASLNIGFESCSGEYLTWTSDDNKYLPTAIETLVNCLEKNNADLVFSRCEIINDDNDIIGMTSLVNSLDAIYYENIVLASFLYKREVHEKLNGYDTSKFLVEDYDFWIRAYKLFSFNYIDTPLYQIRFHNNNLGNKYLEDVKLRKIQLLKDNIEYVASENTLNKIYEEISKCYYENALYYQNKINERESKTSLLKYSIKNVIKSLLSYRKKH